MASIQYRSHVISRDNSLGNLEVNRTQEDYPSRIGVIIFVNPIYKVVRPIWCGMKMLIFVELLVKTIVSNQIRIPK